MSDIKSKDCAEQNKIELKRRKAISRIVATTGMVATMSGEWKKPVLESAILPAHADSSGDVVNCLLHGTPVLMFDGSTKAIETLAVGQLIRAVEIEDGNNSFGAVTKLVKNHQREAYFLINDELRITHDHPVRVRRDEKEQWIRVEKLIVGDLIKSASGYTRVRTCKKIFDCVMTVYTETSSDQIIVQTETSSYVVKSKYGSKWAKARTGENEISALSF